MPRTTPTGLSGDRGADATRYRNARPGPDPDPHGACRNPAHERNGFEVGRVARVFTQADQQKVSPSKARCSAGQPEVTMSDRKLATIRRISAIDPIPGADATDRCPHWG